MTLWWEAGIGVAVIMRGCRNILMALAAGAVAVVIGHAETPASDENGLWQVWAAHANVAADHAVVARACEAFRSKTPGDPLAVVAQGLECWHLLKAGKTNEAARLLEPMAALTGDALPKAGAEMARAWLTRLDRESVRAALKRVYLRDIEYPVSLEAIKTLKKASMPPLVDRWDKAWEYKAVDLPTIKGAVRQRYVLESSRLKADSDLAQALAVPYASRITIQPMRVSGVGDVDTVEFVSTTRKSGVLMVGGDMENVTFAFVGKNIIVLADRDHWRVVPRPR